VRPAIGELVDRIPSGGIEAGRLDHHRFHDEAVARFHLKESGRGDAVLLQVGDSIRFNHPHRNA
jgi:hypothetical protein